MSEEHENPGPGITPREPWEYGYVDDKLCMARRSTMIAKIENMEKSIKLSIAIVGVLISVILIITKFIP